MVWESHVPAPLVEKTVVSLSKSTKNGLKTHCRSESVKFLEENIGESLYDIGLHGYDTKSTGGRKKAKIGKWDYKQILQDSTYMRYLK